MNERVEGDEAAALFEQVSTLLMRMANDAEDREARALALACRDAVEHLFVVLDVLEGPARQALASFR